MTFAIVGGGQLDTGYTIDNSLRFNSGDSPYLSRTPSTSGDQKKWTFSCWFKKSKNGASQHLWSGGSYSGNDGIAALYIDSGNTIYTYYDTSGTNPVGSVGPNLLRDTSAWYHIVWAVDAANTEHKIWLNGELISTDTSKYPPDFNYGMNRSGTVQRIGGEAWGSPTLFMDGYMAEVYHLDGQYLTADDFAETDEDSGIWKPKDSADVISAVTFGTNGFYLDYEDSGSLGADQSGNGNNFTPTNLASTDQTTDTPTNNFATLNPIGIGADATMSNGSLQIAYGTSNTRNPTGSTIGVTSGKWYWEVAVTAASTSPCSCMVGLGESAFGPDMGNFLGSSGNVTSWSYSGEDGQKYTAGSATAYGATFASGDIVGVAFDVDAGTLTFYKNGVSQGTAFTGITGATYFPAIGDASGVKTFTAVANFGQDGSFAGNETAQGNSDGNGYGDFYYAPPSGYLALCTQNLATELSPTIDDGSEYFNTVLYTGTGVSNSVTGVGFQPDFVWEKARNAAGGHGLYDAVRGVERFLRSNSTDAEQNTTNGTIDSFDVDGFTLNADTAGNSNYSGRTYVAWNWLAGGTGVSNTDGSITSTVSANTTAGFSIITYTGTGASGSVGHGLTKAPEMVICKQRTDAGTQWQTGHTGLTNWTYKLLLNDTAAESVNANVFPSAPTSTVINLGLAGDSNGSGKSQLIYAFHSVEGYSKFGSYTGNSSTDGPFVYTGFRPAFVIMKNITVANAWNMFDTARDPYNYVDHKIFPNLSNAEQQASNNKTDFLSNGFKLRESNNENNASGSTYIYMAFAENPFVSSTGVPVTAR